MVFRMSSCPKSPEPPRPLRLDRAILVRKYAAYSGSAASRELAAAHIEFINSSSRRLDIGRLFGWETKALQPPALVGRFERGTSRGNQVFSSSPPFNRVIDRTKQTIDLGIGQVKQRARFLRCGARTRIEPPLHSSIGD